MAYYLDPKNDLTFKHIFGEHEHLCMSLLNNLLPLEEDQRIVGVQYNPIDPIPGLYGGKDYIIDIRCTDNRGCRFIVAVYIDRVRPARNFVLFYASKTYVQQLKSGQDIEPVRLQPVYELHLFDDIFDSDSSKHYHHYRIVDAENDKKQIKGLEIIIIELPKFLPTNRAEKKQYDLWLTLLTKIKEGAETVPHELMEEKETMEAVKYLERDYYTQAQLNAYERYRDAIKVIRTYYADGVAKGLKEGMEEGLKEAREERIRINMEKGRAESVTQVIINCKLNGFSMEMIQAATKLSKKKIEEIINSTNIDIK
jgi:predicted transposase/invertase (TIGR01784 family)